MKLLAAFALAGFVAGCASSTAAHDGPKKKPVELQPLLGERSPRRPEVPVLASIPAGPEPVAIVGATLLLGNGARMLDGTILFEKGRIIAVGTSSAVSVRAKGAKVIDGRGKFVTPGLIDTHSHLGVYAVPSVDATADGNEMTDPTTPYVFSEHAFWPQDPAIFAAVAGGVTTIQVLPGSGNVIGGRAVTLKLAPYLEARAMRFLGAPNGLKMACGENPKRVYGPTGRAPMSRMGSVSKLRAAFIKAQEYRYNVRAFEQELAAWRKKYDAAKTKPSGAEDPGKEPRPPDRDLGAETLADVLDGKIRVHVHCYRADEMLLMISLAKELGFSISSFHHAVEAYKIADVLAREGIGASMWSDWWGFKLEAYDGIEENVPMVAAKGGRAIVHSDSPIGIQQLNQDASKALHFGIRAGIPLDEDEALRWITSNPAWALGVLEQTGTLEAGKMADVVIWDRSPFSIYASAEKVFIDGRLAYDRALATKHGPGLDRGAGGWSDFVVGTELEGEQ